MTQHEDHTPGGVDDAQGATAGSGAEQAPGPQPHSEQNGAQNEELTVDGILNAEQSAAAAEADADEAEKVDPLEDSANPYLDDLRRLTADYANYRKRTEANAEKAKVDAKAAALMPLLSVLDDLDRAESHGDLEEGSAFGVLAQKLRGILERMGLEGFGEKGEPFDPQLHEAIAQVPVPGTEGEVVLDVIERGYRIGDKELRPAKVAVAVSADG